MNYLRDEFLEKSIAKSEAVEEQKLGGVQMSTLGFVRH